MSITLNGATYATVEAAVDAIGSSTVEVTIRVTDEVVDPTIPGGMSAANGYNNRINWIITDSYYANNDATDGHASIYVTNSRGTTFTGSTFSPVVNTPLSPRLELW